VRGRLSRAGVQTTDDHVLELDDPAEHEPPLDEPPDEIPETERE
jgi:hypothetical protein